MSQKNKTKQDNNTKSATYTVHVGFSPNQKKASSDSTASSAEVQSLWSPLDRGETNPEGAGKEQEADPFFY